MGLSGRPHKLSSRSGREVCRVRKSQACRKSTEDSVWSVPVTVVDAQVGDAGVSGRVRE